MDSFVSPTSFGDIHNSGFVKPPGSPFVEEEDDLDESVLDSPFSISRGARLLNEATLRSHLPMVPNLEDSCVSLGFDSGIDDDSITACSTTPSTPIQERRKSLLHGKFVHFSPYPPDTIPPACTTADLFDSPKESLWWSTSDLKNAQRSAREDLIHFRKEHPRYVSHFCSLNDAIQEKKYLEEVLSDSKSAIYILSTNELAIRGLELRLLTDDASCVLKRRVHLQTILVLQKKMGGKIKGGQSSYDEKMRTWASQSSRSSRLLAKIIGNSDAVHVRMMEANHRLLGR